MDMNEAVAKAIASERAIAGLTVRDLSDKSGISLSTLMRLLNAERDIKLFQIVQLAEVFGITPHRLVENAEEILKRDIRLRPENYALAASDANYDEEAEAGQEYP